MFRRAGAFVFSGLGCHFSARIGRHVLMEAIEPLVYPSVVTPTFTQQSLAMGASMPADWDSDGDIDYLGYVDGYLMCGHRQTDGSFVVSPAGAYAYRRGILAAVDIDLDGDLDLVGDGQSTSNGTIDLLTWQRNDGTGHFGDEHTLPLPVPSYGVSSVIADVDRDGDPDLVVNYTDVFTNSGTAVYLNDGSGEFNLSSVANGVGFDTGGAAAAADLDGDDDVDLAVPMLHVRTPPISGVVRILRNDGRGNFTFWQDLNIGGRSPIVALADMDNDGDIDLLSPTTQGSASLLAVLYNNGSGDFTARTDYPVPASIYETICVADMNGDSAMDVVTTDKLALLLNDGTGQLLSPVSVNASGSNHWYSVDDLDGDGRRDINSASEWMAGGFTDTPAPVASRPVFVFNPQAGRPSLRLDFSEDVRASLSADDFQVVNLTTGQQIPVPQLRLDYSAGDMVSLLLPATLADGNYRLTIAQSAVKDIAGNSMSADFKFDFFFQAGDANRDRVVDTADLTILSSNWQGLGKTFSQGDFNYDGQVDIKDLYILSSKWQTALAPPPPPAMTVGLAAAARRTPTRVATQIL